jgi:predicted enzyme related to lactoylglutathione lyase
MDTTKTVHHHTALYVSDMPWYISFFTEVFAMSVTKMDGDASNPKQAWLDGGIQLIRRDDPDCDLAHLALSPPNLDHAISLCKEKGLTTLPRGENWLSLKDGLILELK